MAILSKCCTFNVRDFLMHESAKYYEKIDLVDEGQTFQQTPVPLIGTFEFLF